MFVIGFFKKLGFTLASSIFLARKMVSFLDFQNAKHIVELGAGNGVVTAEIIKRKSENTKFDIFEIDEEQVQSLRERFGNMTWVTIYSTSAAHMDEMYVNGSIDAIISTLPLGSISAPWVDHILRSIFSSLKIEGQYIQYQYWMANRKDVKKYFTIDSTVLEPRNFGPAWIYRARKTRNIL